MESDAQWKECVAFSKQIHTVAETALKKFYEDAEELRPHLKSSEIFLTIFKQVLGRKNEQTQARKKAVALALQRIKHTSELIDTMRKDIEKDKDAIKTLVEEAHQYAASIEREKIEIIEVGKKLDEAEVEEDEQTRESRRLTAECEAELASIMPAIEKALASLDLIKPADLAFMKSMKNPPAVLKTVIASICVMLQIEPDPKDPKKPNDELRDLYWGPAKKLLGDVNLMRRLREYDKDNIPEHIMKSLRTEFLSNPDFEPTRVARASSAAESFCRWVIAMEKYDKTSKEILIPKREALAKAQLALGETLQAVKQNKTKLNVTEQKVADLETKLAENETKKKAFETQIQQKDGALERARELIDGLIVESTKWSQILEDCRASYKTMVGDSVLSAACITYLGPLPQENRTEVLTGWVELIGTSKENTKCSSVEQFSLHKFCNDTLTLEKWRTCDFPQDPYWLDNATIIANSGRFWPISVDPLGMANKWIKEIEKDNSLVVVKPSDEDFIAKLKEAIKSGSPVLLEDGTETLDPQLADLVTKKAGKSSHAENVMFGEESIPVHKNFRFYVSTKLRCLKPYCYFKPDEEKERDGSFTVINFVPTIPENLALQHALLSGVVAKEKRKLEAERLSVIAKIAKHRCDFIEIGEKVLNVLANPQGGRIISVEMTLGVLEVKKPVTEIEQQMQEDEAAMKKIESSLDPFRKLTIKLAKRFCSPNAEDTGPFDLEAFIQSAL